MGSAAFTAPDHIIIAVARATRGKATIENTENSEKRHDKRSL